MIIKNFWFCLLLSSFSLPIWAKPVAQDGTALETENGSTSTTQESRRLSWDTQKVLITIENISFYAHALANAYCLFSYIGLVPETAGEFAPQKSDSGIVDSIKSQGALLSLSDKEIRQTSAFSRNLAEKLAAMPASPTAFFNYTLGIYTFTSALRLYLTRDKIKPFFKKMNTEDFLKDTQYILKNPKDFLKNTENFLKDIMIKYPHFLSVLAIGMNTLASVVNHLTIDMSSSTNMPDVLARALRIKPYYDFTIGMLGLIGLIVPPVHVMISGIKYCWSLKKRVFNKPPQKIDSGKALTLNVKAST